MIPGAIINLVGSESSIAGLNKGWLVRFNADNKLSFYVNDGDGNEKNAGGGPVLSADKWYHFVGVVDSGNTIYYYLNGNLQSSASLAGKTLFEKNYGVDIGCVENTANRFFDGSICDVRLYNRIITIEDMRVLRTYYIKKYGVKADFNL